MESGRNKACTAMFFCMEILMEMERFKHRAGEEDQGAAAQVPDLVKAFERVSLPVVWA